MQRRRREGRERMVLVVVVLGWRSRMRTAETVVSEGGDEHSWRGPL